jgi:general secretion pathway protein J
LFVVRSAGNRKRARGFTLLEVMVAVGVMALVATGAYLAIDAASRSSEATREALQRFERVDRAWALMETDFRNAVARLTRLYYGPPLPAMSVEFNSEYRMTFLRGGRANPLLLPRTELARVGYRLEDGVLWRDIWYDPARIEPELATQQKLVDGVKEVLVRVLPPTAQQVENGNWLEEWPGTLPPMALPVAVEVTLTLEDMGEVTRLFELAPGGADVPGALGAGGVTPGGTGGAPGGTGGTSSGTGGTPGGTGGFR